MQQDIYCYNYSVSVMLYYATVLYCCLPFYTRQAKFDILCIIEQLLDN